MEMLDDNSAPSPDSTGKILGILASAAYLTAAVAGLIGASYSWKAWDTLQTDGAPDAEVFARSLTITLGAQIVAVFALAIAIALQRIAFSRYFHPKWLWWTALGACLTAIAAAIMPTIAP